MDSFIRLVWSPNGRRAGAWALRATGPLVLAFLLIRVVNYGEFGDLLGDLRYGWMIGALASVQLIIVLRTLRWMELHRVFGLKQAPFAYQLRLTYATNIATLVLPQIVNPFSRLILLLQDGYRTGRSMAASVLEKLLDFASYLAFGVIGSVALAATFGSLAWWAIGLALASVLGTTILYALRDRVGDLARTVLERLPGVQDSGTERTETTEEIMSLSRPVGARLLVWSLAISMTQATMLYFITRAVGIDLSYPFIVAVWSIIAFSFLLPLSVNGVGTREAILATAFNAVDESTDAAVAIGLLTLAVIAVGSSPGLIEWLRRFAFGGGRAGDSMPTATAENGQDGT